MVPPGCIGRGGDASVSVVVARVMGSIDIWITGDSVHAGAGAAVSKARANGNAAAQTTLSASMGDAITSIDDGDATADGIVVSFCAGYAEESGSTACDDMWVMPVRSSPAPSCSSSPARNTDSDASATPSSFLMMMTTFVCVVSILCYALCICAMAFFVCLIALPALSSNFSRTSIPRCHFPLSNDPTTSGNAPRRVVLVCSTSTSLPSPRVSNRSPFSS